MEKKPFLQKNWPMLLECYPTWTCSAIKSRALKFWSNAWIDSLMENWETINIWLVSAIRLSIILWTFSLTTLLYSSAIVWIHVMQLWSFGCVFSKETGVCLDSQSTQSVFLCCKSGSSLCNVFGKKKRFPKQ